MEAEVWTQRLCAKCGRMSQATEALPRTRRLAFLPYPPIWYIERSRVERPSSR